MYNDNIFISSRQQVWWEWLKCFRKPWFFCTVFVCLAFKIDERASKQDFRWLSLFFTGNHYNWVFSKTFLFPFARRKLIYASVY